MYGRGPTQNESNANLLNTFDFSEIDVMDPSLSKLPIDSINYKTISTNTKNCS